MACYDKLRAFVTFHTEKTMNRSRTLAVVVVLFGGVVVAGDRWWEVYTPDEQKKIFAEYDKYLYPDKDGKLQAKSFYKARDMFAAVPGEEGRLVKSAFAWGDLWPKASNEQKSALVLIRVGLLQKLAGCNSRSKGKLVEKWPDRMIDEYFWMTQFGGAGGAGEGLTMIGRFGPRATRIADDLREWYVRDGATAMLGISASDVKEVLEKIKKK